MKGKKLLSILALSLSVLLMACGSETPSGNSVSAAQTIGLEGVSIDFEDGNLGFVTEASSLKGGDPVELTVEELNGSKALKTTNVFGKKELYLGFDVETLLGENVKDVATIQFTIGVTDEVFNPVSGNVYAYVGKDNEERVLGSYSVYLDTYNPKTVSFEMKDSFEPGAFNYIIISKEDNAEDFPSDITIDNIGFFDKDGNVIKADTTLEANAHSPLNDAPVDRARLAVGREFDMEGTYGGDWGSTLTIPAEYFDNAEGNVNVTLSIGIESGREYYLIAPIPADNWNNKLKEEDVIEMNFADDGILYHLQKDGFIKLDDWASNAISFTITKDAAKRYVDGGGMTFQIYGIKVFKAVVSHDSQVAVMNGTYGGDWGQTSVIPAELFANATGDIKVSVDIYFEPGKEYYVMAPIPNTDWSHKFKEEGFSDMKIDEPGEQYHLQPDGFFGFDDHETDILEFTITKDTADVLANGGGLTFQTYGITAASALITPVK